MNTIDATIASILILLIAGLSLEAILLQIVYLNEDISRINMQKDAILKSDILMNNPVKGIAVVNNKTMIIMPGEVGAMNCKNNTCGSGTIIVRVGVHNGEILWFRE